ncbi:hypothetical protein ACQR1W_07690 [Bradyrhizobium sp. HKCCYLS1011]|uniref:hypothetical protein n=1 Tax=Bradyrhizobium sp. HKCCYLS1011 TaxID=3420733 RepID=UPI003EC0C28C
MRRLVLNLISLLGFAFAGSGPARADGPWIFAQVACVPQLGYFSIRKILMLNLPYKGPYLTEGLSPSPAVVNALESRYRIFDSQGLSAHPVTCIVRHLDAVPGWEPREREGFKVEVIGHYDSGKNARTSSYCMMTDSAEVLVNGKSVGSIVLNPCENAPMLVSIEVAHDGVELAIRQCSHDPVGDKGVDQQQLVCRQEPLARAN